VIQEGFKEKKLVLLIVDYLYTSLPDQEVILSTGLPDCCSNKDLPFLPQGRSKDY